MIGLAKAIGSVDVLHGEAAGDKFSGAVSDVDVTEPDLRMAAA